MTCMRRQQAPTCSTLLWVTDRKLARQGIRSSAMRVRFCPRGVRQIRADRGMVGRRVQTAADAPVGAFPEGPESASQNGLDPSRRARSPSREIQQEPDQGTQREQRDNE